MASAQVMTSAFEGYMARVYKEGLGFDHMPPELMRTLDNIDPGLARQVYSDITASRTLDEIMNRV